MKNQIKWSDTYDSQKIEDKRIHGKFPTILDKEEHEGQNKEG